MWNLRRRGDITKYTTKRKGTKLWPLLMKTKLGLQRILLAKLEITKRRRDTRAIQRHPVNTGHMKNQIKMWEIHWPKINRTKRAAQDSTSRTIKRWILNRKLKMGEIGKRYRNANPASFSSQRERTWEDKFHTTVTTLLIILLFIKESVNTTTVVYKKGMRLPHMLTLCKW